MSSFRSWNSSALIPSPSLGLLMVNLLKASLTSHCRMSGSRRVTTLSWLIQVIKAFLYHSSVYFCHVFLISSSLRSLLLLSFIVPILKWNIPVISPVLLKRFKFNGIHLSEYSRLCCSFKAYMLCFHMHYMCITDWLKELPCIFLNLGSSLT